MFYFAYIIESQKDYSFYIGHTKDIKERMEHHNSGMSTYTSKKMPWKLVYYEKFLTRSEAIKREKFLKKQRNKEFYNKLIKAFNES